MSEPVLKTLVGVGIPVCHPTKQITAHTHTPDWETATLPDKNGIVRVSCMCGCWGRLKCDVLWGTDRNNGVVAEIGG
jgi:hypothetical protein